LPKGHGQRELCTHQCGGSMRLPTDGFERGWSNPLVVRQPWGGPLPVETALASIRALEPATACVALGRASACSIGAQLTQRIEEFVTCRADHTNRRGKKGGEAPLMSDQPSLREGLDGITCHYEVIEHPDVD
jgi:hypothetical protein